MLAYEKKKKLPSKLVQPIFVVIACLPAASPTYPVPSRKTNPTENQICISRTCCCAHTPERICAVVVRVWAYFTPLAPALATLAARRRQRVRPKMPTALVAAVNIMRSAIDCITIIGRFVVLEAVAAASSFRYVCRPVGPSGNGTAGSPATGRRCNFPGEHGI